MFIIGGTLYYHTIGQITPSLNRIETYLVESDTLKIIVKRAKGKKEEIPNDKDPNIENDMYIGGENGIRKEFYDSSE